MHPSSARFTSGGKRVAGPCLHHVWTGVCHRRPWQGAVGCRVQLCASTNTLCDVSPPASMPCLLVRHSLIHSSDPHGWNRASNSSNTTFCEAVLYSWTLSIGRLTNLPSPTVHTLRPPMVTPPPPGQARIACCHLSSMRGVSRSLSLCCERLLGVEVEHRHWMGLLIVAAQSLSRPADVGLKESTNSGSV